MCEEAVMFEVEKRVAQVRGEFNAMVEYVLGEGQAQDAYGIEVRVFRDVLALGLLVLRAWFAAKRGGDVGAAVATEGGEVLRRERLKRRRYLTVFGELGLPRWYYHREGSGGLFPLDEAVNLPHSTYSYFVQELTEHRVGRMAYDEALGEMKRLFGFAPRKEGVKALTAGAAADVDPYYHGLGVPAPQSEGEVLAVAVDGKGVPILKGEPAERRVRLRKGEKHSRKKEAVVSAVYTIDAQRRSPDDVIREVRDHETPPKRPEPRNKRVRATMEGKKNALAWVHDEVERRDPEGRKHRVCLTDAGTGLQPLALAMLSGFTLVLDLFHALEYLWKAAYAFHPEGSEGAEAFVRHRLRLLLEGKVGRVIGGLRQMLTKHRRELTKGKRKRLETAIRYYQANRRWMRYDVYLAAGYPIGSGAAEGACRHLVKDRMEGAGMRWSVAGADAVLKLRAVTLNGDWDAYWQFHMQREAERRYGHCRWRPLTHVAPRERAA
jgi:hypothetical protein